MFENPQNLPVYAPLIFDFRWRYLMRKLHKAGLERKQAVWGGHVNVGV